MTPDEALKKYRSNSEKMIRWHKEVLPKIVGELAVKHYKESFQNEGFTNETLEKWQDVERRNPSSPWYGFSATNKKHFSEANTTKNILTGESGDLGRLIFYIPKIDRVSVGSNLEYAPVHQFGQPAKVFGKKSFVMKARPFIGKSAVLNREIKRVIFNELKKL